MRTGVSSVSCKYIYHFQVSREKEFRVLWKHRDSTFFFLFVFKKHDFCLLGVNFENNQLGASCRLNYTFRQENMVNEKKLYSNIVLFLKVRKKGTVSSVWSD